MSKNTKTEPKQERKRTILGGFKPKMTIPDGTVDTDKYVLRWAHDEAGGLDIMLEAGYTFVEKKSDTVVGSGTRDGNNNIASRISIVANKSKGTIAYLMKKRKDWHEEDQEIKQQKVDAIDNAIHRKGNLENNKSIDSGAIYGQVDIKKEYKA